MRVRPPPPFQVLGILATVLQRDADERGGAFNGRPYFRLCIGLLAELSPADPTTDEVGLQYLQVGPCFHCQGYLLVVGSAVAGPTARTLALTAPAQPGGRAEAPLQHGALCCTSALGVPPSRPFCSPLCKVQLPSPSAPPTPQPPPTPPTPR